MTTTVQTVISELLMINKDALAALVTLGSKTGDPVKFVSDPTDRFVVNKLLNQFATEPRTAAGSLD